MRMPASINFKQKVVIGKDRDSAVQTALSGNTVYSLPKWTARRNMVDLVLMIMDEDGPIPMVNMRPTKKRHNAADQFEEEQQGEYEARARTYRDQIERVHNHNNAYPKMYDELDKRRSIAETATYSSSQTETANIDPNCPKCIKRKKRLEEERKKHGGVCEKCREKRTRKESRNKLDRVKKQRVSKARKQQSRCRSNLKVPKPCIIYSNKCFQCHLATETKSVSTFKSNENLQDAIQEITQTTSTLGINIQDNNEQIVLNSNSFHKKKVAKKPGSTKSDRNPDTETGPSVSSYNSFMSTEHEPMVE